MDMRKLAIALVLVVLGGAWEARGATAGFQLVTPDATHWQLFIQVSTNDNFGIWSIGATVLGANTAGLSHLVVTGPTGQITDDPGAALGFVTKLESATSTTNGNGINFSIAQPTTVNDAGEFVYSVGQTAGSFSAQMTSESFTPTLQQNDNFAAPVMIAKGTMPNGVTPTLYLPDLTARLFLNKTSTTSGQGTFLITKDSGVFIVPVVPEPASLALLGLGGLLMMGGRKRKPRAA
jgi:hypothetical protein